MNKKILSFALSFSLITSLGMGVHAQPNSNTKELRKAQLIEKLSRQSNGNFAMYNKEGKNFLMTGKLSDAQGASRAQALKFINDMKEVLDIEGIVGGLKVADVQKDSEGFTHVKVAQTLNGIPVDGKYIMVHFNKNGEVSALNGDLENKATRIDNAASTRINASKAIDIASKQFNFNELRTAATAEKEVIVKNDKAYETYKVNIQYNEPEIGNWDVYVDAYTGSIIDKNSRIRYDGPTTGTGVNVIGQTKNLNLTLTTGKYYMQDQTKAMSGQIKTYTANSAETQPGTMVNNTTSTFNTTTFKAAVSAHDYAGVVYDFYKNLFNRNSIDNAGMSIISTVHYGSAYNNAFWDGSQMVYGDGDGSTFTYLSGDLDVVGHEMTHGVTERSANLTYHFQPGALNESMSDVLGVLIQTYDKYNVKGGGAWTFNAADWVVGDQIYTPGTAGDALRSLANPTLYGQPAHMNNYVNSADTEAGDWGGVHTNSGIPNKAGFLVAQSIGCEKTARIYYRALTSYMTSTTDFLGAKNALVQAATDLYGAGGAEVTAITNAYNTVGVASFSDTYEPNGTISQAYAIASGSTYNSYIASASDIDYYKLTTTASGTISVSLTNLAGDYDLYIVNSAGTVLAKSENGSTTSESISYSAAAGTYYVKVNGYNGAYSTSKAYALKATYGTTGGDLYEPNDSTSTAYAMASGTSYASYIYTSTDVDYSKFTVSTAKTISISLTTLPGDYDLYLYNSAGTLVAKSENGSTTAESISYSAAAGTYYVKVSGYNGAYSTTTKYTLKATY